SVNVVAFDGQFFDLAVFQLSTEPAEVDLGNAAGLALHEHEQHDGQADEQEPSEHPATKAHAAVATATTAGASATAGASLLACSVSRTVLLRALFRHRTSISLLRSLKSLYRRMIRATQGKYPPRKSPIGLKLLHNSGGELFDRLLLTHEATFAQRR